MILRKENIDTFCTIISELLNNNDYIKYKTQIVDLLENDIFAKNDIDKKYIIESLLNNISYDNSLSFKEVINKLLNSFKKDNLVYKVSLDNLIVKFHSLSDNEKKEVSDSFMDLLSHVVPYNTINFWKNSNAEIQLIYFDKIIDMYPSISDIIYLTDKKVLEKKYSLDLFNKICNTDYIYVPEKFFVSNMKPIINKLISINKLYDFLQQDSFANVKNYLYEIFEVIENNLESINELLELNCEANVLIKLAMKKPTEEEIKIHTKLLEKYGYENLVTLSIDNNYSYLINLLIFADNDKESIKKLTNDLKIKLFEYCIKSDDISEKYSDFFDQDFIINNINNILKKLLNNEDFYEVENVLSNNTIEYDWLSDEVRKELENKSLSYFKSLPNNAPDDFKKILNSFSLYSIDVQKEIINEVIQRFIKDNLTFDLIRLLEKCSNEVLQSITSYSINLIIENAIHIMDFLKYLPQEYQDRIFLDYISNEDYSSIIYALSKIPKDVIDRNEYLLKKNNNSDAMIAYLNFLEPNDINDDLLKELLNIDNCSKESLDERISNYKKMLKYNSDLNKTIHPLMLDNRIFSRLKQKSLLRIVSYPEFQRIIVNNIDDEIKLELVEFVTNNYENYVDLLDYGFSNERINIHIASAFDYYSHYVGKIPIDKKALEACYKISSLSNLQLDSIININSSNIDEEIFNYGLSILKGEKKPLGMDHTEKGFIEYSNLTHHEKNQYCLSLILFGMDYSNIIRIVKKYALYIENIDYNLLEEDDKKTFDLLSKLKNFVNRTSYNDIITDIISNEQFYRDNMNKSFLLDIEYNSRKMFEHIYDNKLFKAQNNNKFIPLGTDCEFTMLVRVDGAYDSNWVEPDNYLDSINRPNTTYHGNCKSLISDSLMAIARPRGPIFGYNEANMQLCAPYDIVSKSYNVLFSISNNSNKRVAFMDPETLINRTRHNHNEIVSERLIYNSETDSYEKDKPDYIVWLKDKEVETEEELMKNSAFNTTLKAAKDLSIPIVIIDRYNIIKNNEQKLMQQLNELKLIDETSDIYNKVKNIIVSFYNNKLTVKFVDELNTKYFTDKLEKTIFDYFNDLLDLYYEENYNIYTNLLNSLIMTISEELDKAFDVSGKRIKSFDISYLKSELSKIKSRIKAKAQIKDRPQLYDSVENSQQATIKRN